MTFNMHMDNKTYKEPKVSKVTPIKYTEGQDFTDYNYNDQHTVKVSTSVHPWKGFDAVLETDFPHCFLNDIPLRYLQQIVAPMAFSWPWFRAQRTSPDGERIDQVPV